MHINKKYAFSRLPKKSRYYYGKVFNVNKKCFTSSKFIIAAQERPNDKNMYMEKLVMGRDINIHVLIAISR